MIPQLVDVDGRSALWVLGGNLPPNHEAASGMVASLAACIPDSPTAPAWSQAFRDFLAAESDAERAEARANLRALHASTLLLRPLLQLASR